MMISNPSATETRRPLLTVEQFAAASGFRPKTIRNWIYLGDIPYIRLRGRALRLRQETLDEMIARGDVKPRAKTRARRPVSPQVEENRTAPFRQYSGGAR